MPLELERKFLVKDKSYRDQGKHLLIRQGFLCTEKERVVRIRIYGDEAFLTIKGSTQGIARAEYEYRIPREDARYMLDNFCLRPLIEKYRYKIPIEGFTWEVDEFLNDNDGLIIAEIELTDENQDFPKPAWLGEEVTGDPRYYNANLVKKPYLSW